MAEAPHVPVDVLPGRDVRAIAFGPAAAVDEDQHRPPLPRGQEEVEAMLRVVGALAVGQVGDHPLGRDRHFLVQQPDAEPANGAGAGAEKQGQEGGEGGEEAG